MYLYVSSDVYYNINTTTLSPTAIKDLVTTAISSYSTNNLSDFKKTFRYSNFISTIDNADSSIISNDTNVLEVLVINPTLNTNVTYALNFNNVLITDHPITAGEQVASHKPAIKSSPFTYIGNSAAFLQDNGQGILHILAATSSGGFVYLSKDAGTVDYVNGTATIKNLNISAYEGSDIRLYGRTAAKDISSSANRILTIRPSDVTVNVYGVAG